jgi:nitrogen regulatory protein PII
VRLILATLRPAQVEIVRQALADIQVTRMTVCDAQGHGSRPAPTVAQEVVMEIACNDDFVERTVARLTAALGDAALGSGGDPRVVVLPIAEAVQIYREVRGPEAI